MTAGSTQLVSAAKREGSGRWALEEEEQLSWVKGYGVWGEAGGAAETRRGRVVVAVLPNVREVDLIWRTVGRPGKPRRDGMDGP